MNFENSKRFAYLGRGYEVKVPWLRGGDLQNVRKCIRKERVSKINECQANILLNGDLKEIILLHSTQQESATWK